MHINFFFICLVMAKVYAAFSHLGYNYDRSNVDNFLRVQPIAANSLPVYNIVNNKYLPPASMQIPLKEQPIVTKQFFMVSAPEESNEIPKTKHLIIGRPQRNYRIVFIKAPASEQSNVKLTAEYAPQEEKTVIYVLSKKANEIEIDDITATTKATVPSKPDVFFIKYKTPEEATAAQKEIQEQYDRLGGTTEFSDEGIAPVKSVIGLLDSVSAPNGGYNYNIGRNEEKSIFKDFSKEVRYF